MFDCLCVSSRSNRAEHRARRGTQQIISRPQDPQDAGEPRTGGGHDGGSLDRSYSSVCFISLCKSWASIWGCHLVSSQYFNNDKPVKVKLYFLTFKQLPIAANREPSAHQLSTVWHQINVPK